MSEFIRHFYRNQICRIFLIERIIWSYFYYISELIGYRDGLFLIVKNCGFSVLQHFVHAEAEVFFNEFGLTSFCKKYCVASRKSSISTSNVVFFTI